MTFLWTSGSTASANELPKQPTEVTVQAVFVPVPPEYVYNPCDVAYDGITLFECDQIAAVYHDAVVNFGDSARGPIVTERASRPAVDSAIREHGNCFGSRFATGRRLPHNVGF
ncbi:hypothetical protein [Actinokineospora iranica]|uniref:hypothetical protein n=1 Tax=Actinokineospora iranica TaxID=1271860 RepID=UPI001113B3DF|nr:hypothetical protein [Actinokineospora iranica]